MKMKTIGTAASGVELLLGGIGGAAAATDATSSSPEAPAFVTGTKVRAW